MAGLVPYTDILEVWQEVSPFIDRGLAESSGKFSKRFIFDSLLSNKMQLWMFPGAVLVTRVLQYPEMKVFEAFVGSGDDISTHLDESLGELEDYAREAGCTRIEIWGRKGWSRMLKSNGFESTIYISRKEL